MGFIYSQIFEIILWIISIYHQRQTRLLNLPLTKSVSNYDNKKGTTLTKIFHQTLFVCKRISSTIVILLNFIRLSEIWKSKIEMKSLHILIVYNQMQYQLNTTLPKCNFISLQDFLKSINEVMHEKLLCKP